MGRLCARTPSIDTSFACGTNIHLILHFHLGAGTLECCKIDRRGKIERTGCPGCFRHCQTRRKLEPVIAPVSEYKDTVSRIGAVITKAKLNDHRKCKAPAGCVHFYRLEWGVRCQYVQSVFFRNTKKLDPICLCLFSFHSRFYLLFGAQCRFTCHRHIGHFTRSWLIKTDVDGRRRAVYRLMNTDDGQPNGKWYFAWNIKINAPRPPDQLHGFLITVVQLLTEQIQCSGPQRPSIWPERAILLSLSLSRVWLFSIRFRRCHPRPSMAGLIMLR